MSRSSPPYRFRFPRITTTTFQSSVNSYRQGALVVAPERSQLNSSNRSISMRRKNRLIGVLSEIKKIRMKSTNLYFWLGVVCMSVFQFMLGSAITGLNPLAASSSSTVGDGPYGQFHRKASAQLSGEQQPREVLSVRKKGSNLQIGLSKLVRKQADRTKESIFLNGEADLVDPILESIVKEGMFYSLGRKDRSGSVVSDMLFAHAFAWAHNVTYAGACYTTKGLPKKDTRHLLEQLRWDHILPFQCPTGVGPHLDDSNPNATELSPLILDRQVYRDNIPTSHFTKLWRESLQDSIARVSSSVALAPDRPFDIAVHVRRGDVTPCRYKRRYLTNEHYLKLIDKYTPGHSELDGRRVHVTIYSETDSFEPFEVFRDRGYTLELDTQDLSSVWKALTTADVVILSRSYFSFVPAAVNPNVVVATHFFEFEPLDGWKRAEESLVKDTDKKIRQIFNSQCNATAIELERMKGKKSVVVPG